MYDVIYATGRNDKGQLGLGHTNNVYVFEEVVGDWGKIAEMSCGFGHTILRTEHGKVYATGSNYSGQLGIENINSVSTFMEVAGSWGKIAQMSCGDYYTFLRTEDGKVYAAGNNYKGQQGHENTDDVITFTEVVGGWEKIAKISCGYQYTFLLSVDSKMYATGYNVNGQLGLGHTNDVCTFEEIGCDSRNIAKVICGTNQTFLIKGKICRRCGCIFTPKKLSDEMLMATKIPGICLDMIYKIIKLYARMSAEPTCRDGSYCYC